MTVLALDIGSSSVRALLFDDAAQVIRDAVARRKYAFTTDTSGASTAHAHDLRRLVEACIDEVLRHQAARSIRAVGMATFVGNLLGVGPDGEPITPIYTYADTRCADALAALRSQIDASHVHERTGCPLHTAYHPPKLRWLREQGIRAALWLDFGTWLYRRWFGRAVPCSFSIASWSGLLDRTSLAWDDEWLHLLDLDRAALPQLSDYSNAQFGLAAPYAARWEALAQVPFFLPIGDGAAANIGSGATGHGTCALTIGTTAAVRIVTESPPSRLPAGLWNYRVDASRHLIGGATSEGGGTIAWVRSTFRVFEDADPHILLRPADGHGLTFLPLLTGERSPGYRADATGTLHGLRAATTPLDVLQAALESVALRLATIAQQLGVTASTKVYASGGALTASPVWGQICADALNAPLLLLDGETTARGIALLVLQALGETTDFAPAVSRRIEVIPERAAALRLARERQAALYAALYDSERDST